MSIPEFDSLLSISKRMYVTRSIEREKAVKIMYLDKSILVSASWKPVARPLFEDPR